MTIEQLLLWPLMLGLGIATAAILAGTATLERKRIPAKVRPRRRPF